MSEAELLAAYQAEIIALEAAGAAMPFVFRPNEAAMLLGLLQLALSHPNVASQSPAVAAFGRELAENISKRLGAGRPAIAEVCRRGWRKD